VAGLFVAVAIAFAGCATVYNLPGNLPLGTAMAGNTLGQ
jgi:NTE family protein